jgi:quinol monooxygenase YgiN
MPVTVIATLTAVEGKRDELLAAVCRAVPGVLQEDGCLQYAPHTVGKDAVLLVESWQTPEALQAHGAGAAMAAFTEAIRGLVAGPASIVVARPVDPSTVE